MNPNYQDVSAFVRENDIKFIRLAFCDLFGVHKNISILPSELLRACTEGMPFDASAIAGFSDVKESDLFLTPDLSTLSALPWRPQQGGVIRFYCAIKKPDGSAYETDTRALLERVTKRCNAFDLQCKIGTKCEFYLFKTDENGEPTEIPFDRGGYCDVAPLDKGENVRREICLCLEEMGITPETSHHEAGPGQNEIDFKFSSPLHAADNLISFQSVVRNISARNGLYASLLPKPVPNQSGSGLHVTISLARDGKNIFTTNPDFARHFIAGILNRAKEMTAFLNPLPNSYERLGTFRAPKYISWSHQNRSQLIRIPAANSDATSIELRSPDPTVNPYLAFALILSAGLEGVEQRLTLPPAVNENLYAAPASVTDAIDRLPHTLEEALAIAKDSAFIRTTLGEVICEHYFTGKQTNVL